jgi:hypothetical protein
MGGKGPSKPKMQPVPESAEPLDYDKMFKAARENSRLISQDQIDQLKAAYPEFEKLQLGTINKVAGNLDNKYTRAANEAINAATQSGDRIGDAANRAKQLATEAQQFATGPTDLDRQIATLGASSMQQRADQVAGAQVADVGDIGASVAEQALMREAAGSGLLGQLESQAAKDMALGRNLSAEQEREAIQSARAGMSARGLGAGNAALAAEVLNRDRFASQRENERRAFASGVLGQATGVRQAANQSYLTREESNLGRAQQRALTDAQFRQQASLANQDANQRQVELNRAFLQNANQSGINSQISRGSYAGQMLGQTANMFAQQGALGLNIANANLAVDPYQRAFAPGASFGQGLSGQAGGMLGQAYGTALNTVTNTNSFNANMLESRRNTVQNNNAALQSAYMGAKASENAANMGLQGAAMGASAVVGAAAAACWIARAAFGTATARWKDYRRAMLRHASDRTIRLYCQHGQSLAAAITTPLRRFAARLTLRTLQWSWN